MIILTHLAAASVGGLVRLFSSAASSYWEKFPIWSETTSSSVVSSTHGNRRQTHD
jgi:hypothetical protein